jgi:hypothetical protein
MQLVRMCVMCVVLLQMMCVIMIVIALAGCTEVVRVVMLVVVIMRLQGTTQAAPEQQLCNRITVSDNALDVRHWDLI